MLSPRDKGFVRVFASGEDVEPSWLIDRASKETGVKVIESGTASLGCENGLYRLVSKPGTLGTIKILAINHNHHSYVLLMGGSDPANNLVRRDMERIEASFSLEPKAPDTSSQKELKVTVVAPRPVTCPANFKSKSGGTFPNCLAIELSGCADRGWVRRMNQNSRSEWPTIANVVARGCAGEIYDLSVSGQGLNSRCGFIDFRSTDGKPKILYEGVYLLSAQISGARQRLMGIWRGTYRCQQGETGLALTIEELSDDGNVKAVFSFYDLSRQIMSPKALFQ
jgi:hypothetical protein